MASGGVFEEDAGDEQDKGPLVYQEAKSFSAENCLVNVYDNMSRKFVTFEIYGLDSQDMFELGYEYRDFDNLFRFNAELMNPNRKEGRFHWVVERLALVTLGKDRKLQLQPELTDEVSEVPVYETGRKIPTGRMDLKERQRLREQMDMLDIKRAENISKKRKLTKQRFLQHLFRLKQEDAKRKIEVEHRILEERSLRVELKAETEKKHEEELQRIKEQAKLRRKIVAQKEQRSHDRDEGDYKQLRLRWKALDAQKARVLNEKRERQVLVVAAKKKADADERQRQVGITKKREVAWKVRFERIRRREVATLKRVLEEKAEMQRQEKMRSERNQEYIKLIHIERQPVFAAQLQRTIQRRLDWEAEEKSVEEYDKNKALPKKLNKKARSGKKQSEVAPPPKEEGEKGKEKKGKDKSQKVDTDKVLDAVEAKMRAQIEEAQRRADLERIREKHMKEREQARKVKEIQHLTQVKQDARRVREVAEKKVKTMRLIVREKEEERQQAELRRTVDLERLAKVRAANIARKEKARLA